MRNYELTVVIPSDVPDDEVPNVLGTINGWIESQQGKIVETNNWGRRKLAYTIADYTEGTYVLMLVDLGSQGVFEVERNLKLSQQVIRYLLVRIG